MYQYSKRSRNMKSNTIQVFCPINNTGYGIHSINFVTALSRMYKIRVYPISGVDYQSVPRNSPIPSLINDGDSFDPKLLSIKLWHDHDMATFAGSPRIAYTVFELDNLSERGWNHLNSCDYVWVVSSWAKQVLMHRIPEKRIFVVPEGCDSSLFEYSEFNETDNGTPKFLSIGKLELRKGHMAILDALPMLSRAIDVYAHWDNPFLSGDYIGSALSKKGWRKEPEIIALPDLPQVTLYKYTKEGCRSTVYVTTRRFSSQTPIRELMKHCDFGLYPYFAEGWNLPLIECLSSGMPCIATNYSGPTQYLEVDHYYPIRAFTKSFANDGVFFRKANGRWCVVEPETIAESIEDFLSDYSRLSQMSKNLKGFGQRWSWENVAEKADQAIREVM
jgi:glycosyltransferase involved in cell wall biosynthesis